MAEQTKIPPTGGWIVQYQVREGVWRPFHVTNSKTNGAVTGWVLMSPDDLGCDQHGVIPTGTPQSPMRAFRDVLEGEAVGQWRWLPRV